MIAKSRLQDNSDEQYASLRNNIPYLALVVFLHPLLRRAYDYFWRADSYIKTRPSLGKSKDLTHGLSPNAAVDARLQQRVSFDFWFAILFIIALHGFSALKIILILFTNYILAKTMPRKYMPAATWIFNIAILFANELGHGYPYARIAAMLSPFRLSRPAAKGFQQRNWGNFMDDLGGLIPRWEVLFNITILRLISFNLDYYWSLNLRGASPVEVQPIRNNSLNNANAQKKKQLDPSNLSERDRTAMPAKPEDYSFRNYFAYALYAPLYLAGPILTFNDYIHQQRYALPSITTQRTFMYAIRFLVVLLTMEFVLHFIYTVAIFKAKPDWGFYTPFQLGMLGYFNLHIIWLKLLIPWRFFRLWALIDKIDPPENMVRCMSNNYSALAFWRSWHRSYNRWIIRYIYVPLGGSRSPGLWGKIRSIVNFLAVFTFVALWHDINLRLLMWGWLITLFVLPEIIATLLFPAGKWTDRPNAYRVLCGIGAVGNILMMMIANLVGFAIGIDGLKGLMQSMFGNFSGWAFFACACGCLFVGSQIQFEIREEEKRQGIRMNC